MEDAAQVLDLQQRLLVLVVALQREGIGVGHQLVELLLQVDLVLQLLVRLEGKSLLLLVTTTTTPVDLLKSCGSVTASGLFWRKCVGRSQIRNVSGRMPVNTDARDGLQTVC